MRHETLEINSPHGPLHAQRWVPDDAATPPALAPWVLFHESLGCVALWRDFPQQLARATGRAVIAYDRLGFGRSASHPGQLPPNFIDDEPRTAFAALRAQLGLTRFLAFGHSVGGAMAAACAAAFPADCEAVVFESAQAFVEDLTLEGIRAADRDFARPGQLERLAKYHGDKARWVLRAWVDTWLSADFRDWNQDATLTALRCPVLSLHGDQDEYGSMRQAERLAAVPAGPARLHRLPGCGHVPHRQQPEAVLSAVRDFLADWVAR